MYISVYPIALSVRSSNVYEEQSLGIYDRENSDEMEDEEQFQNQGGDSRVAVWGRYLSHHARRQLAFDIWWLALAVFLVCIIEVRARLHMIKLYSTSSKARKLRRRK